MNEIKEVKEIKECPGCASLNIILNETRNQIVCKDCGLIFEPTIPIEGGTSIPEPETKPSTKKKKTTKKKKK